MKSNMKIVCRKEELVKGTSIVAKAVPNKTTMPILMCVLIDATLDQIKLTSNDMTLGIQTVVEGNIVEHGMIALEAKMFFDIVKKMPEGKDIAIEVKDRFQVSIKCGRSKFEVSGNDPEEFAYLPIVECDKGFSMSCYTMRESIQQVIFAVSDSEANKVMTGVLFDMKEDNLRMVALDGHRIALRNIRLAEELNLVEMIVPGKSLQEIFKILPGDMQKQVKVTYTSKHIAFEMENTLIISRLIEGKYFEIERMISENYETKMHINRKQLQDALDRSTLFIKESDKKPIVMDISDEELKVSVTSSIGSMNDEIEIECQGKKLVIAFNPRFILDALRVIQDEEIDMYFMNSRTPAYICDQDRNYLHLMLPVNRIG